LTKKEYQLLIDNETVEPKFDDLVGEGKRYKTPDEIAKAKLHADTHIDRLEKENAELRAYTQQAKKLEDLIAKLEANPGTSKDELPVTPERPVSQATLTEADVLSMVDKHVTEKETKRTKTQNIEEAKKQLRAVFGDKYAEVLKSRSSELGISIERMTALAEESPNALIKLVVQEGSGERLSSPPRSSLRTDGKVTTRNYAFYQNMRKEDPRKYFSKEVSWQRMKDAESMGDAFYN
jgi:uncharacterized protein YdcH (DUF465 family)